MYLTHSEIRQLDMLKKKNPSERFLLMSQVINDHYIKYQRAENI